MFSARIILLSCVHLSVIARVRRICSLRQVSHPFAVCAIIHPNPMTLHPPSTAETAEVAAAVGFRVRVILFEKLSVLQQVQTAASVDVIVGVHGEAL